jgi:NitT/TauT family transport system substrate-binding protein
MGAMSVLRISATAHGLNYLPEYLAAANGMLRKRGLEVTTRPRDPWTGVLDDLSDGSADLALGGIWVPAMYAGKARDLVVVGQLNARFPMAVVTREPAESFDWGWMAGRTVLAPGAGGSAPYEFMAGLMREAGVSPASTRFVRDLSTDMLLELFEHGLGDGLIADLLSARRLQRCGAGYVALALADAGGPMPNSVYYARRDRLESLHDRTALFLSAVQEAMEELTSGNADPTPLLASAWPAVPLDLLGEATAELSVNGTWSGIRIEPAACERWVDILRCAGLVNRAVSYDELVDTRAVDAALGEG